MKIPFSLLSPRARQEWVEVPAHPEKPALGLGRVKLRELSPLEFDGLWADLVVAEKRANDQAAIAQADRTNEEAQRALTALRETERLCQDAVLCACIVDHDPQTFHCEVPTAAPGTPLYAEILRALDEVGYSAEESCAATQTGQATKPFLRTTAGSADPEMARFYRRCQPDGVFVTTLLILIYRFQQGELLQARDIWRSNGLEVPGSF